MDDNVVQQLTDHRLERQHLLGDQAGVVGRVVLGSINDGGSFGDGAGELAGLQLDDEGPASIEHRIGLEAVQRVVQLADVGVDDAELVDELDGGVGAAAVVVRHNRAGDGEAAEEQRAEDLGQHFDRG